MIPDDEIFPQLPTHLTLSIATNTDSKYIKRPNFSIYEIVKGTTMLADVLLHEAQILESLMINPHKNIARYHGVLVENGRIVGLVFDKYKTNLTSFVKQGNKINIGAHMEGLGAAVAHLHSLDLAHNDINPGNIMLDGTDSPILIDFGSCGKQGLRLHSCGTPGWILENFVHSHKKHDLYALGRVLTWFVNPELA